MNKMKSAKIIGMGMVIAAFCAIASEAAIGVIGSTKKVMIFPTVSVTGNPDPGKALTEGVNEVFKEPETSRISTGVYLAEVSPSNLDTIGNSSGADVVVLPLVSEWKQYAEPCEGKGTDREPMMETWSSFDVYVWEKGKGTHNEHESYHEKVRADEVRNDVILQNMVSQMKQELRPAISHR